jgi:hypothetical protein
LGQKRTLALQDHAPARLRERRVHLKILAASHYQNLVDSRTNKARIASMPSGPLCWWCASLADSSEHSFKKPGVKQAGKTWSLDDRPYYVAEGVFKRIQGPDSKLVKFGKVLCHACNTTRSQTFDLAYDVFTAWVNERGEALMADDTLDFTAIFGPAPQEQVLNLVKYFAKHLGCRVASNGAAVPADFVAMMNANEMPEFQVTLSRNELFADLPSHVGERPIRTTGILHNLPFRGRYSAATGSITPPYRYGSTVGHLDVIYRFGDTSRFAWEGESVDPLRATVKLGLYIKGEAHPSNGGLHCSEIPRMIEIGGRELEVPLLSPEQIQHVVALGLPTAEMTPLEQIDASVRVVYAALSPFHDDLTVDFLEENLTWPAAVEVWRLATGQRA